MPKPGKNYRAALAKVDLNKQYSPQEGVALAKETAYTKFDASVEVHMRTALDPRQADQQLRDVVVLPNGLGKTVRVLVFAGGEGAAAARAAGADLVAHDEDTCDKCGGALFQRDDDKEGTIKKRLDVYQQQTAPLIDYYSKKKIMKTVTGVGSIEEIFKKAVTAIG